MGGGSSVARSERRCRTACAGPSSRCGKEDIGALAPDLELFPTRLASRYRLELLSPAAARVAIKGPAESVEVEFRPEAVDRLVSDLRKVRRQVDASHVTELDGPFIEPVHLQVVCKRLWDRLPADATSVTADSVQEIGDVDQALAEDHATAVTDAAKKGPCDEGDVRRWIESSLIVNRMRAQTLSGTEGLHNVPSPTVEALEKAYVIRREERRLSIWYELAHDRLVAPILQDNARRREEARSELEKQVERWIADDYISQVMMDLDVDDRILGAQALAQLVTSAGTTIQYPLMSLDTPEAGSCPDRLRFVIGHLLNSRLVTSIGDDRHSLVHDRLVAPVLNWLRKFRSPEAYRGFARVFYQAQQILEHAESELVLGEFCS